MEQVGKKNRTVEIMTAMANGDFDLANALARQQLREDFTPKWSVDNECGYCGVTIENEGLQDKHNEFHAGIQALETAFAKVVGSLMLKSVI